MKIAQVVCAFPPYHSGIGQVAHFFAKELSSRGHDVSVLTPQYGKIITSHQESYQIRRLRPILKLGNGAFLPQLVSEVKHYNIVHLHYPFFGGAESVWLAKKMFGPKFKLFIHYHMEASVDTILLRFLSWPTRLIRSSLFAQADSITCASLDYVKNSNGAKILERHKDKFKEIPFGVDINKFQPLSEPSRSNTILFVGGLDQAHYFKGLEVLLRSVAKIKNHSWRLQIVGEGELKSSYQKTAQELGILEKVEFAGGLNSANLANAYQQARVLVLPSINQGEAFGLVLLEAMACGIPVIATKLPGVRKVFTDGQEGIQVPVGDAGALRQAIVRIFADDQMANEMGKRGRALVEESYSWTRVGAALEKLYENLFDQ